MAKEQNNALLISLVVLVGLLSIVGIFLSVSNSVDEDVLSSKVTAQVIEQINIPTAAEVAALVPAVDLSALVIPEPKEVNSDRIDDLWNDLNEDEIDELEAEAYDVAELELEDRDYKALEKYLEAEIEGFDELRSVDIDDYEVTVIELGLEEDEDKVAEVVFELKVKYTTEEGQVGRLKMNVLATATVLFDEGDFDEEDVELVFA